MTPEQWKKMKAIYKRLYELPKEEWEALLSGMCEGDEEIQNHLQCLLNMPPGFLEREAPRPYSCTEISLSPGEILAGRWRIEAFLGMGGMADVYAAYDKELDERVALKVIRSDVSFDNTLLDRFKQEVELARQVRHRNVCAVYDIGRDRRGSRDLVFLTMQLIPGETMADRLQRTGPLDRSEWFPVAKQLCKAIQEAHHAKVLHRDFKPGNVMLVGSGKEIRAVVTDFGIARAIGSEQDPTLGLTARSMILGTLPYMSPEQKTGADLAETSDIYALGLVLYEMITGKQYFQFPQLEDIPEPERNWRDAIQRCLEDDPTNRFQAAFAVLEAVEPVPPPSILDPPQTLWQQFGKAGTIVCILLVSIGALWATGIIAYRSVPLPPDKCVAILPLEPDGSDDIKTIVAGWQDTTVQKLRNLRDSHLFVLPMTDTIGLTEKEMPSAAKRLGFNIYIAGTIKKNAGHIYFNLRLQQVNAKRPLRIDQFSIPDNDNGSTLSQKIAALLELSNTEKSNDISSQNQKALNFYAAGRGYLLYRDVADIGYAVDQFEKAFKEDPQFADAYAYFAFANSLKYRKTHDRASMTRVTWAQARLAELQKNPSLAHLAAGLISQDTGDLGSAITDFEIALKSSPVSSETRNLLAMAYLEADRIREAKQLLIEAIQQEPRNWFNHNDLGYVYYKKGELANAQVEFQKAVDLAPDNSIANANLAGLCLCFGKYSEADVILERILASKKSAMSDTALARVYEKEGYYANAINLLEDATQLRGMIDQYWLELGGAYKLQKMNAQATQSFRKALELAQDDLRSRPNDGDLQARIALYDAELGLKNSALSQLEQAQKSVDKRHLSEEFLINSARVYELLGKRPQALNALRLVLDNRCARFDVEIISDFESLRSDHRYTEIINQVSL